MNSLLGLLRKLHNKAKLQSDYDESEWIVIAQMIEKMQVALIFYADQQIYKQSELYADHSGMYAPIEDDKGEKARKALE